jgi:hypothetical protein
LISPEADEMSFQADAAFDREEVGAARQVFVDMSVQSLVLGEARRRVLTRMFGVSGDDQSLLVTMLLIGSVATVLRGVVVRPWPRPSGAVAAIGGAC